MGRANYKYDSTNCTGGINGQDDEKLTQHQCKEALNVWAPNGVVEKRPGFIGVTPLASDWYELQGPFVVKEDNSTTPPTYTAGTPVGPSYHLNLKGLQALAVGVPRDRWYVGYNPSGTWANNFDVFTSIDASFSLTAGNTNATTAVVEYYSEDGRWLPLALYEEGNHLQKKSNGTDKRYAFVPPRDWADYTITAGGSSYTTKWIRFSMAGQNVSAGDIELIFSAQFGHEIGTTINILGSVGFSDGPRYISLNTYKDLGSNTLNVNLGITQFLGGPSTVEAYSIGALSPIDELGVLAPVPDFDEAYLSLGYNSKVIPKGKPASFPVVESDPDLLTEYTGIDLLPTWPKAKFTQYFRGELWVANLEDSPYQVQWSAPEPIYKAWPLLNTEYLVENDKSPITGLYGFGQNMVVFKNDSIYEMIDTGISVRKLQTYAPERRVAGKGSVSHHSIANVNGRLVFLAEDGVYAYDGSPNVMNLGMDHETNVDRIKHIIKRVTPGARQVSVGVNWSTKHCYLLALPLDGASDNTHVLCYDYENDSWWLWDIEVRLWMLDEGPNDDQNLYFSDKYGLVYRLDRGATDHGAAIDAYVITRQMVTSTSTLRAREVEVISTNLTRGLEVSITAEDEPVDQATPAKLIYTDEVEKDYNVATYDVDKYTLARDRKKAVGVLMDGNSFRVKIEHTDKYSPFKVKKISVGYIPVGKR